MNTTSAEFNMCKKVQKHIYTDEAIKAPFQKVGGLYGRLNLLSKPGAMMELESTCKNCGQ